MTIILKIFMAKRNMKHMTISRKGEKCIIIIAQMETRKDSEEVEANIHILENIKIIETIEREEKEECIIIIEKRFRK